MLLHSGAGLHRHEFSTTTTKTITRRRPLTRSSFSSPSPRNTINEQPLPIIRRPGRSLSEHTPRVQHTVHFEEPEPEPETITMSDSGNSITTYGAAKIASPGTTDSESVAEESFNDTSSITNQRRRSHQTKQTYVLARPAPTLTQNVIHIRPRNLLQLQLVTPTKIVPEMDVRSDSRVFPRLANKFPNVLRAKRQLGPYDVTVMNYNSQDDYLDDAEGIDQREIIAVICQLSKCGKAEITLGDETTWSAIPDADGNSFKFRSGDISAQWTKLSSATKFGFSIIQANTRKHPIMARLSGASLTINDEYVLRSSSATTATQKSGGDPLQIEKYVKVTDDIKALIKISAIWVALRQGLAPSFKYESQPPSPQIAGRRRSQSHKSVTSLHSISIGRRRSTGSSSHQLNSQLDGTEGIPEEIFQGRGHDVMSTIESEGSRERNASSEVRSDTTYKTTVVTRPQRTADSSDQLSPAIPHDEKKSRGSKLKESIKRRLHIR